MLQVATPRESVCVLPRTVAVIWIAVTVSRPSLAVDWALSVTVPTPPRPAMTVFGPGLAGSAIVAFGTSI
ncbi:MAG TPA: hypothetical protein VFI65_30405 [Streptosporangiaceae bacterium]|nr:hypothetical protein [Streptosporangiaceae bacterium]